jgi:hypothetical protein
MTDKELLFLLLEIQAGNFSASKLQEAIDFLSACLEDPELTASSWKLRKKYKEMHDFNGGGIA